MLFEYLGWNDASQKVKKALEQTIKAKKVTYDLHRQIEGGEKLSTSEFAEEVASRI